MHNNIIKCPFCLKTILITNCTNCDCCNCTDCNHRNYTGIIKGPKGDKGDPATNFTTSHMSAIHTGGITLNVSSSGTNIPLNGANVLSGFTANETFETYTVDESGTYFLIYNIKTRDETTVKTRVTRNDILLSGTVRSSSVRTSNFSLSIIVNLNQGDQISLQMYDLNENITLQGGTGASFVLIRLK